MLSTANGGQAGTGGFGGLGAGGDRCFQGTFSVYTSATGTGFGYSDGTTVTASFGRDTASGLEPQTATTSLDGGAFELSFASPTSACNLGASRVEPVALYIDVDGDGACRLAVDDVFVWGARGGPQGNDNPVSILPGSDHCEDPSPGSASSLSDAARRLCPEIGDCLAFCRAPAPLAAIRAYCAQPPDAGVVDAGEAPDADVGP